MREGSLISRESLGRYSRVACGFLAVAMAIAAQRLLGEGGAREAGLLYAGSVIVAICAFHERSAPAALPPVEAVRRGRRVLCVGLVALGAAGVLGILSLQRFASSTSSPTAWMLHVASVAMVLVGARLLDLGRERVPSERGWSRLQVGLLVGILALAAVVRFWGLGSLPFGTWYDEAENGLVGLRILEEPGYLPLYEPRVNSAGHYLLLLAGSLSLLGRSTAAVRSVSALMGVASVAAAYLVGRELLGRWAGLAFAFFLAVSRWSINFSRMGMYNVATPLFELVALGFLLRGLRRRRFFELALAGVGMGLGMVFYVGFLSFPLVLVIFLAHSALSQRQVVARSWRGLLVLVMALALTVGPVAQYSYLQSEEFWERTGKTSVFKGKTLQEALPVIRGSVVKYALMFNYQGDRYGRHNLSGEPMLDPLSGALMVLGFGVCLWGWRRPRALLLPVWLLVMLLPGILSLEWEAPQALRTIGSLPAAYLLAVVPLHALGEEWHRVVTPRLRRGFVPIVALLLVVVACSNLHTYFCVQARDLDTWRDFSTAETITARLMGEVGPDADLYVISYFYDHPVLRFLVPQVTEYSRIDTDDDLPLPQSVGREAVIFLDGGSTSLFDEAQRYYPGGIFEEYGSPFGGPPVVLVVRLSAEDISELQGLLGYYREGDDWTAAPSLTRQDAQLSFDWPGEAPLEPPFLVEWRGVLRAPEYGNYRVTLRSPAVAELYLDDALLLRGAGEQSAQVMLARGNHDLRISTRSAVGHFELAWQPPGGEEEVVPPFALYAPPVTANGLLGRYFANADWEAPLAFARLDRRLGFYYHIPPLPMPYTAEWEGSILIPESGAYVFALQSIDESTLYLDGEEVVASTRRGEYDQATLGLMAGYHHLRVRYAARTDHMYLNLYWTPPGASREIIPPEVLFPPSGSWQLLAFPAGVE
jgi:4-amino-4-deoxy-L-arabinose transferase-like glycosyltransferase